MTEQEEIEQEIKECTEKIEIYDKLLATPEFQYFLKDCSKIKNDILSDPVGILGSYQKPGSGCENIEAYRYTLGYLHGMDRMKELARESLNYAVNRLKELNN